MTFDVDFKHKILYKIFRLLKLSGKIVISLPRFFTIEKSLLKILLHIRFLFLTHFQNVLWHIL